MGWNGPRKQLYGRKFWFKIGVEEIQIGVNSEAKAVKIIVTKYDIKPSEVATQGAEKVYQYLQIKTINLEDKLDKATITIKVNKTWVFDNNLAKEDIALFKFDEQTQKWNELKTNFIKEDNNYYYYEAELTGFSYFTIAEKTADKTEEFQGQETPKEKEVMNKFVEVIRDYWLLFVGIVVILALIIVLFVLKKKKSVLKRKNYK